MVLIKKDILFSKRWLFLYIVCIICLPVTVSVIPIIVRFFCVEDGLETEQLLKSLPISKGQQIRARLALATGLIFIGSTVHTAALFFFGMDIVLHRLIMSAIIALASLYLFILLAYRLGYQKALFTFIPIAYLIF